MADVRCPMCGKLNPPELEKCNSCGARIKPLLAHPSEDSQAIKAGRKPTKRDTSEFEKLKPGDAGSIHPGDAPTKKNTAELEQALPSWLRSLRDNKDDKGLEGTGSAAETPAEENPPPASAASPTSGTGELPDWLAGLGSSASAEEEEVPDWLAGLRGEKPAEPAPLAPQEPESPSTGEADWALPGGNLADRIPEVSAAPKTPASDAPPEIPAGSDTPDWLQSLQSANPAIEQEPSGPAASSGESSLPDWLSGLPAISAEGTPTPAAAGEPAPVEPSPDWLSQLKKKADEPLPAQPAAGDESVPDWLANFGPAPGTPNAATGESVPEWLSNLESKSSTGTGPLIDSSIPPGPARSAKTPDWLSELQADVNTAQEADKHKDDFEVVSEPPAATPAPAPTPGTGPLPEWLAGVDRSAPPAGGAPALIGDESKNPSGKDGEAPLSMEAPDWLSKLKPEQIAEKAFATEEESAEPDNLEASELPSWVQAMRPVEAVVSEATSTSQEENQVTEQSGPLAGLHGVLPVGPGLGTIRKPPPYSVKLQVSDGQQRYAAFLERLVAGESHAQTTEVKHLASSRLWRWLITVLLVLAVGLPMFTGVQVVPPTSLASSDVGATKVQIEALSANTPVLVAFDYEPALSGELEATAAPIFDQLLSRGIPLVLISTSPTGPALAERFLNEGIPLVNVHNGNLQYFNLGYLAGGPAGISYFAMDPKNAAQYTGNINLDWGVPPLQGIQRLSDFSAIIVLTDNADTGRNWIEQTDPYMAKTPTARIPMMMIISAQAEPMIRPYFDSGQLKGLVAGLADAKVYEQTYTRPGLANYYWNSYGLGILVAVFLIGFGALWSAITGWRARQNNAGEEA